MTYKPEFQSRTTSFDVRVVRTLSYLQVDGDLYVYKLMYVHKLPDQTPSSISSTYADTERQGFATLSALQDFSDNKVEGLAVEKGLTIAPEGFLKMVQLKGYVKAIDHFEKEFPYQTTPGVYDIFEQSEVFLDRVVRIDRGSDMLFDVHGGVLPTALYFDYTRGQMDEASYDLDLAVKVLSKDLRIATVDPSTRRGDICETKLRYYDIPYYNSEPGRTKTLSFTFSPTKEDMVTLWGKAKSLSTKYPSTEFHRAVFELDMLGLRAAGAAKHDSFYG